MFKNCLNQCNIGKILIYWYLMEILRSSVCLMCFQNVITYLNFALAASVDVFVSSYVSAAPQLTHQYHHFRPLGELCR